MFEALPMPVTAMSNREPMDKDDRQNDGVLESKEEVVRSQNPGRIAYFKQSI